MAAQEKNRLGDGSDNYAGAAKQAANAAKSAKEAGKTAAKETAKKGAEATSRAAAVNCSQVSRHKKAHYFMGAGYFVCSQYKASASFGVSILSVPCGLFVL